MGKYIKKHNKNIDSENKHILVSHYKNQSYNGPSIIFIKNEDTNESDIVFTHNNDEPQFEVDEITSYTWDIEGDGLDAKIKVTFTAIHPQLINNDCVFCFETNTCCNRKGHTRNQTLKVFDVDRVTQAQLKGKTFLNVKEIELNKTYIFNIRDLIIYSFLNFISRKQEQIIEKCQLSPSNFKFHFYIRPTIRTFDGFPTFKYVRNLPNYCKIETTYDKI
jgi:hypothetical protein